MTLQRRMTWAVGTALLAVMVVLYALCVHIMMDGFVLNEQKLSLERKERLEATIAQSVRSLSIKSSDWSSWDDSYEFVSDGNQAFVTSNLGADSLMNLRLKWIIFADAAGTPFMAGRADGPPQSTAEFCDELRLLVREHASLFVHTDSESEHSGLLRLGDELYQFASRPVLPSSGVGTPQGSIMFVQSLDDAWLGDVREVTQLDVELHSVPSGGSAEQREAYELMAGADPVTRPGSDEIVVRAPLADYVGRPIAMARFVRDRPIHQEALRTAWLLGGILAAAFVTAVTVVSIALRRTLLMRLLDIHTQVGGLQLNNSARGRLRCAGTDELSQLTSAINRLLDELDATQARIAESELRFRTMSDHAPMAVWTADEDGRCTFFNRAWAELTGRAVEEQLVNGWADSIVETDRTRVVENYRNHLLAREPFDVETQVVRPDGERRWILGRGVPRFDEQGRFTGFIGSCIDITERRELEEHLRAAKLEAEAASRTKSDFLANMSHEIRTPMTAILGYAEILNDPSCTPEDRVQHVQTIRRNGEHLLAVINDILDVSKIEAGKMTVESIETPLVQTLEEAMSLMTARAVQKGLTLTAAHAWPLPKVVTSDPTRLRQIVLNLLSNAIKFTERGTVTLRASHAGDRLRVQVADTGIGMTQEQMEGLFRPFVQADTSVTRRFGGTGLGLTISRNLARLLGGDLTVESVQGVGTTFTLEVHAPAVGAHGEAAAFDSSMEAPAPLARIADGTGGSSTALAEAATRLAGLRVLLAEDGVDNQRLISMILRKAGADVTIVDNGQAAVDAVVSGLADGRAFDLVLMDMQMPVLDGYSATSLLRQQGHTLPVIALTAHSMAEDRDRCLKAGCSDYLTKPVEQSKLISTCSRCSVRTRRAA